MKLNRPHSARFALTVVRLAASTMAALLLLAACIDQTDVASEPDAATATSAAPVTQ